MPIIDATSAIDISKEKHICLIQCVSEKDVKSKLEPNLYRILAKFPHGNSYQVHKQTGSKFRIGTVKTFGDGKEQRYVTVLFTSFYPGVSKFPNDSLPKRKEWFKSALTELGSVRDLGSIAFDQGNLFLDSGNDMTEYRQLLSDFEATYELNTGSRITIVIYNDPATIRPNTGGGEDVARKRPAFVPTAAPAAPKVANKTSITIVKKDVGDAPLDLATIKCTDPTEYTLDDFCKHVIVADLDAKKTLLELDIDPSWNSVFSDPVLRSNIDAVQKKLGDEIYSNTTFPAPDEIFNAFNYCKLNALSVVILGQDPYPTRGNAHGLSFSVKMGVAIPKSLHTIYSALENDDKIVPTFKKPKHGCLTKWAQQGVLLLNAALTVKEGTPESHLAEWVPATDRIIQLISQKTSNVVFILWGAKAKAKKKLINALNHCILEYNHPSSQVAGNTFGKSCKNFSEANDYLTSHGKKVIDWQV